MKRIAVYAVMMLMFASVSAKDQIYVKNVANHDFRVVPVYAKAIGTPTVSLAGSFTSIKSGMSEPVEVPDSSLGKHRYLFITDLDQVGMNEGNFSVYHKALNDARIEDIGSGYIPIGSYLSKRSISEISIGTDTYHHPVLKSVQQYKNVR